MPLTCKSKHKYGNYDRSVLVAAVLVFQARAQTPSSASRVYGIPKKTLTNRLKNPYISRPALGFNHLYHSTRKRDCNAIAVNGKLRLSFEY